MKILFKLCIGILFFCLFSFSYADPCVPGPTEDPVACAASSGGENLSPGGNVEVDRSEFIEVTVTEEMPGLDCSGTGTVNDSGDHSRYICKVPIGMKGGLLLMGRLIRWATGFALLCAVLYLVFNGIRLSSGGLDGGAKGDVKTKIMMTLGGIILLLLSGPILKLIAPWVYQ